MLTRQGIVELLKTNDRAVARALVALNLRQTQDEQASESTRYHNGQGFRPCHARMGTSMAQFYQRRGYLTDKQISYWRRPMKGGKMKIEIYANQLLAIAQERSQQKATAAKTTAPIAQVTSQDIGNLMEERLVLQEVLAESEATNDTKIASTARARLGQIDNAAATAEKEMQQMEAECDQEKTRVDELNKFLARCRMEGVK